MPSVSGIIDAIPLPQRKESAAKPRTPVWPVVSVENASNTSLDTKCDKQARADGICCKDLKGDERTLIDPDVVRDIVIGLSDGLTVPFALTAGLSSLGESKLVILGGMAELISGAISMGIGGFLASQAERDHYRYLKRQTNTRVLRSCMGEMEREVHDVLSPVGVDEPTSRAVAKCLMDVEVSSGGDGSGTNASDEESQTSKTKGPPVGLSAFLLRFGEGLEEVPTRRLYTSALTIGMGYLCGGIIPLIPYFFITSAHSALLYSSILTGVILLIFGLVKARITGAGNSILGYAWGAVSTMMVGGAAAAASYGIVYALEGSGLT